MAKISVIYQRSHDIDWFAKVGNIYIHAMSFGGLIPESIGEWNNLRKLLRSAHRLSPTMYERQEVTFNDDYIDSRLSMQLEYQQSSDKTMEAIKNRYVDHFADMARRGFLSFDRDLYDEDLYHLIAKPSRPSDSWNIPFRNFEWPIIELNSTDLAQITSLRIIRGNR